MNTNLLDLNNDILNIIGDYVKKDNHERKMIKLEQLYNVRQIVNGKKIRFRIGFGRMPYIIDNNSDDYIEEKDRDKIPKERILEFVLNSIDDEMSYIKQEARYDKIKLTKPDLIMCVYISLQRTKYVCERYKIPLDMEDENIFLDEYLTKKKLNLKSKKYSFDY